MPRLTHPYQFYSGRVAYESHQARQTFQGGPQQLGATTARSDWTAATPLVGDFAYGDVQAGTERIGFEGRLFQWLPNRLEWIHSRHGGGSPTLPEFDRFWFADDWRGVAPTLNPGESIDFAGRAVTLEIGVTWDRDQRVYPFHLGTFARLSKVAAGEGAVWQLDGGGTRPLDEFAPGAALDEIYWRVSVPPLTGQRVWVRPLDSDSSFTLGLGVRGSLSESRIVRTRAVPSITLGGHAIDDEGVAWTVEALSPVGRDRYLDVTLSRELELNPDG